jgi:cyclopropane fatty-acyl-phospholipid synthase-like methyltransferase
MPGSVQNLYADKDDAMRSSTTLDVKECPACGHIQLINNPVSYFRDVIRAGSFSASLLERQQDVFARFIQTWGLQGKRVLEVGSGRGEYLELLRDLPVAAYGIENNAEFCLGAWKNGLNIFQGYVCDGELQTDPTRFDAVVSINFLEHIPHPKQFLQGMARLMEDDAVGLISVPDAMQELKDNSLLSYMSDHISYFTLPSLRTVLELNGFIVEDIFRNEELNVITAYFKKRPRTDLQTHKESVEAINQQLERFVQAALDDGMKIGMWGASHLAFSIMSMSAQYEHISYIVDSAPFKQGKYAPVSGLRIYPPSRMKEDPVQAVIIFCPEYSDEIVQQIQTGFGAVQRIGTFVDGQLQTI